MKTRDFIPTVVAPFCAMFLLLGSVCRAAEVFTVTFNAPGALYTTPKFGIDTTGTDGMDSLDAGFNLPPFQQLTVRFSNNSFDGTLVTDIRAPGDAKTWVLEVSNLGSGQAFTLSWTVSDPGSFLSDATRFLTLTPRAGGTASNLKTAGNVQITANGLYDIVLKKGNAEPVAMPDSVLMFKQIEASKLINVLANDRDPDTGQTLSIKSVTSPTVQNGTAAIENGQVRYTPAANFKGQDTFSYTIQDNGNPVLEAATTVTVQVEDLIYGLRNHASSATPGTTFAVTLQAYYAPAVTRLRFVEYLPTNNGASWTYVGNSATAVTAGCTISPQQTGNQLSLDVTPSGASLPASPITITYQVTVPADSVVGTTKSLTGDLFVNDGNTAVSTVPQTSFTITLYHTADYDNTKWKISLVELLRVISYYNAGAYHTDLTGPDGFAPGAGTISGRYDSADYDSSKGKISLVELLRVISYYNAGGYHPDPNGPDGYAPGL